MICHRKKILFPIRSRIQSGLEPPCTPLILIFDITSEFLSTAEDLRVKGLSRHENDLQESNTCTREHHTYTQIGCILSKLLIRHIKMFFLFFLFFSFFFFRSSLILTVLNWCEIRHLSIMYNNFS